MDEKKILEELHKINFALHSLSVNAKDEFKNGDEKFIKEAGNYTILIEEKVRQLREIVFSKK